MQRNANGQQRFATAWYLGSVASFMVPAGIQMVLLPYLLTIELHQPALRFGLTQMFGQMPVLMFLLFGGWLADRVDPRRMLIGLHAAALVMPAVLAVVVWRGTVTEAVLVAYALAWGLVTAFAMPARDGLLRRVAGSNIQRMVIWAIGTQFGMQMIGQALGGRVAQWGPVGILLMQCAVLAMGIHTASRLPPMVAAPLPHAGPWYLAAWRGLGAGLPLIFHDAPMRAAFLIMLGVGVFFGGVLPVLIPLAVRDLFGGGAQDIATGFMMFGAGTLSCIALLTSRGGLAFPGRALVLSMASGCAALVPIFFAPPGWVFHICLFVWGMSGGLAMAMSRTILQEQAPATHQSRVMAAHALSTAGGGPVGAAMMGLAVSVMGVRWAVLVPVAGVTLTTLAVVATHAVWQVRSRSV